MNAVRITVQKGDSVRLLPEEAWNRIQTLLFNTDADAPGREEELELYCKMLFHAATTAEARLLVLERKCNMMFKTFKTWRPVVAAARIPK